MDRLSKLVQETKDIKKEKLAYFYIGENYYYQDDYKNALDAFKKSLEITQDPDIDFYSIYDTAWSYMKLGQYEDAVKEFDRLEGLKKDNSLMDSALQWAAAFVR